MSSSDVEDKHFFSYTHFSAHVHQSFDHVIMFS